MEVPGLSRPPRDPRDFLNTEKQKFIFQKAGKWALLKFQGNVMSSERYAGLHHTLWYTKQQPQHHVECLRHTSLTPKPLIQISPLQDPWDGRTSLIACIFHPKLHRPVTWFLMQQCRDVEWWWVIRFNGLRPLPCVSSWQKSTSAKKIKLE